jgi:hypothetical protein
MTVLYDSTLNMPYNVATLEREQQWATASLNHQAPVTTMVILIIVTFIVTNLIIIEIIIIIEIMKFLLMLLSPSP